jgi:predicted DNA-binding ribbon-helix-helix protein
MAAGERRVRGQAGKSIIEGLLRAKGHGVTKKLKALAIDRHQDDAGGREHGDGHAFSALNDFDLGLATPVARSMRLNGKSTCIRLERIYWKILEYCAQCDGVTVNMLLATLDREVQMTFGDVINFSALVRAIAVNSLARLIPGLLD